MDEVLVEQSDGVLRLILNRPEALNALNPPLLTKLTAAIRKASDDRGVGVIVLSGAGRAFSAGVDLKLLKSMTFEAGRLGGAFDGEAAEAARAIRRCAKPVIAKVHGACFTGALELTLHCDFIFTTADAKFGDTHAKWGLRPTWGMSQNLARAIGVRRARELSFTARSFSGADAARWGLANEALADKPALDAHVAARAGEIAAGSRGAISAYKKLYMLHEENRPLEEALATEVELDFPEIDDTRERLEGFGR
ncbi:MAG TPA: enoyl-CoA hydratase/isomerase family protein [Parvularcula sp.]|nr:enoyl-CoA hydratase/isomerase family protein [Parvularcula sp.]HBS31371.1 enoyl-CoA hydratase/isomerase family protein [Parvularcula sp.]HBS36287.1 enoyl-CoA hydratase/isomerase family protein [Parvularcula sp.]